jgi:hypothetical protein
MARDDYPGQKASILAPSDDFEVITPDDDADLVRLPKYLQIGASGGTLAVKNRAGDTVSFPVAAGQVVRIRPHRVLETTDADVIAVY